MAIWSVAVEGDKVKLSYVASYGSSIQDYGASDAALENEVEAFAFDSAEPWDCVLTRRGSFVRLATWFGVRA